MWRGLLDFYVTDASSHSLSLFPSSISFIGFYVSSVLFFIAIAAVYSTVFIISLIPLVRNMSREWTECAQQQKGRKAKLSNKKVKDE